MTILLLALQILTVLGLGAAWFLRDALTGYAAEKGKNLATKEDIATITKEVESIKAAFRDQETRAPLFHHKRFEVLGGIYTRLHDASEFVKHMVHPVQQGGEDEEITRRTQAARAFNDLAGYYWKHKIYVPETVCEETERILGVLKAAFSTYVTARGGDPDVRRIEMWNNAYQSMTKDLPKLQAQLERIVREHVDVSQPSATSVSRGI